MLFFFSSRRRHTRSYGDWSSDVCSSDLFFNLCGAAGAEQIAKAVGLAHRCRLECRKGLSGPIELEQHFAEQLARRHEGRSEERRVGKEGRTRLWRCK